MLTLSKIIEAEEVSRRNKLLTENVNNLEAAIRGAKYIDSIKFLEIIFCWGLDKTRFVVREVQEGKNLNDVLLDYSNITDK